MAFRNNSQGLPIHHDDLTFHDRHERSFQDMQRRMDDDFGGSVFGRRMGRDPWNWENDLDRLCGDFQQLKPKSGSRLSNLSRDDHSSRESLDDNGSSKTMYIEHPVTKSRTFHMSFDVKDYDSSDITVTADGDMLVIMAKHEDDVGGHVNVREFSRKIKIPNDVEIDKLNSTLSNDGILTIQAPVPPRYTNVAVTSNGGVSSAQRKARPIVDAQESEPVAAAPRQQYHYIQPPPPVQQVSAPQQQLSQQNVSNIATVPTQTPSPPPPPAPPAQPLATSSSSTTTKSTGPPPLFEQPYLPEMPLDTPIFKKTSNGDHVFELALEIPRPFTPEDVVVKLEGKSLKIEASHGEKAHGKSSTSTMSRNFDVDENLDPNSVEAMLRSDGCLLIKGKVKSQ